MNDPRRILITGGTGHRQALPDDVAFIDRYAGTVYPVSQC